MQGRLIGIARRAVSRAPMEEISSATITATAGLAGDCKGRKFPLRQITVMERELWEETLFVLGSPDLPWTTRRANLLVEGVHLPRGPGSEFTVGAVRLEVTAQTLPCAQMERAYHGLRKALSADWRGGVTCKVLEGGAVVIGDAVAVVGEIPTRKVHLPG